jgi:hypothetical protein
LGLEHSPLELTAVPEAARKVLTGPGPLKLMAARGLAPLKPVELATVLYQLATDPSDGNLQAAAHKSVTELPERVLTPALADVTIDPRVLDFFAGKLVANPLVVETLLLNRATADETVLELTARIGEKELELVAVNEQRLLRKPEIIAALYMNRKARMSTVDRAIELAVRNDVTVPGIPRWDDLVNAVLGQKPEAKKPPAEVDALFKAVASKALVEDDPNRGLLAPIIDDDLEVINQEEDKKIEADIKDLPISDLSIAQKIRLATIGNAFARGMLIRDPLKVVAIAAINSPGMTDNEVIKYSANRSLSDDVIRVIAATKEWTKLYSIKVNLVNNPKTPMPNAMRLLPFLHDKDLRNVTRSRAIPSAVVTMAKKLLATKGR